MSTRTDDWVTLAAAPMFQAQRGGRVPTFARPTVSGFVHRDDGAAEPAHILSIDSYRRCQRVCNGGVCVCVCQTSQVSRLSISVRCLAYFGRSAGSYVCLSRPGSTLAPSSGILGSPGGGLSQGILLSHPFLGSSFCIRACRVLQQGLTFRWFLTRKRRRFMATPPPPPPPSSLPLGITCDLVS
ncbi:uncharacterized protein LY79DRAFT_552295 [Colletotrichum navitas]|uniref:Uncharacterized protein n=1 Tax=Colletotrichum navitas TaxID=681940 RepID=A0AAD8V562_9PEZI|nr:uncharacterized protein LY79DRAFT_552295 [Colletotrichum navitas]KAK1593269.1 hypothetical protein LY79DRAFT_552295 [Colletotrichum navitas]